MCLIICFKFSKHPNNNKLMRKKEINLKNIGQNLIQQERKLCN